MLIKELFKHTGPNIYQNKKAVPLPNPNPGLLYGLELEIERALEVKAVGGMNRTEDGSLRNGGLEFVLNPMTYSNVAATLEQFFTVNKITADNYSERCSVHVHTNVQDKTLEEVATICVIYQVFERLLFSWIGNDRDRNIFCVPWYDTLISYNSIKALLSKRVPRWEKYTALNILPIQEIGTIEWRHLYGTNDIKRILTWMRLIGHIYSYAAMYDYKTILNQLSQLNTNSMYLDILEGVFQDDAGELRFGNYVELIEDGVLRMKYMSLQEEPKKQSKYTDWADLGGIIRGGRVDAPRPNDPGYIDWADDALRQLRINREAMGINPGRAPAVEETTVQVFFDDIGER